ncbi:hypothetical protein POSPLADRAFT_1147545 [Postia placenta MAD-698-R-SB12]|uniref:SET domain-containing protein n=1 Tax=Postia placenta MAD-698-R-SB12 TaxID=670580 RepID=A0A1X6MWG2_9APHY|nr:hypothetical protein POSPLADRAFT_1147545 [Postia placenta MAD-698-R-SB12]OSX60691.1 hypothetical protein POSPLADRAFT_1147545 [Postia placenta MAD-698-R-SB12]
MTSDPITWVAYRSDKSAVEGEMTREQSRLLYRWVIDTYSPNYKPANNELLNPLLYIMEKDVELLMEADALLSWQGLRHVPQLSSNLILLVLETEVLLHPQICKSSSAHAKELDSLHDRAYRAIMMRTKAREKSIFDAPHEGSPTSGSPEPAPAGWRFPKDTFPDAPQIIIEITDTEWSPTEANADSSMEVPEPESPHGPTNATPPQRRHSLPNVTGKDHLARLHLFPSRSCSDVSMYEPELPKNWECMSVEGLSEDEPTPLSRASAPDVAIVPNGRAAPVDNIFKDYDESSNWNSPIFIEAPHEACAGEPTCKVEEIHEDAVFDRTSRMAGNGITELAKEQEQEGEEINETLIEGVEATSSSTIPVGKGKKAYGNLTAEDILRRAMDSQGPPIEAIVSRQVSSRKQKVRTAKGKARNRTSTVPMPVISEDQATSEALEHDAADADDDVPTVLIQNQSATAVESAVAEASSEVSADIRNMLPVVSTENKIVDTAKAEFSNALEEARVNIYDEVPALFTEESSIDIIEDQLQYPLDDDVADEPAPILSGDADDRTARDEGDPDLSGDQALDDHAQSASGSRKKSSSKKKKKKAKAKGPQEAELARRTGRSEDVSAANTSNHEYEVPAACGNGTSPAEPLPEITEVNANILRNLAQPDRGYNPYANSTPAQLLHLATTAVTCGHDGQKTIEVFPEPCRLVCWDRYAQMQLSLLHVEGQEDGEDTVIIDRFFSGVVLASYLPPIYKQILPGSPEVRPFSIRTTTDRGLGMFATRSIKPGELLVSERPIVVAHLGLFKSDANKHGDVEFLQAALDSLSGRQREAFMGLEETSVEELRSDPLSARLNVNGFSAGFAHFPELRGTGAMYIACFKTLSRANHDCTPNAHFHFSENTCCGRLVAMHDIEEGEEITVRYVDSLAPREERQSLLRGRYNFVCTCRTCSLPRHESLKSDTRRKVLTSLLNRMSTAQGPPRRISLEHLEDCARWAREERVTDQYANVLYEASKCVTAYYGPEKGFEWLKRAREAWFHVSGNDSQQVIEIDVTGRKIAQSLTTRGIQAVWPWS